MEMDSKQCIPIQILFYFNQKKLGLSAANISEGSLESGPFATPPLFMEYTEYMELIHLNIQCDA